ncbi:MAG: hypothetical protein KBT48_05935, partial [Firmicutes bacterium]|nr:hypothetical protein [Bacillota bacterium]
MEFLSELETIEKSLFHGINRKDTFLSKLNEITVHMTNLQIEDQEYLKLMQLYYYKYEMEDNLPGKRYCLIRMHQIHSYQKKKTLQVRFPKLHFTDQTEETLKDFLLDHENLYLDLVVQFIKELL